MTQKTHVAVFLAFGMLMACHQKSEKTSKASDHLIETKEAFGEIDVAQQNETFATLQGTDEAVIQKTSEAVLQNPNDYNPPVLYALSHVLFQQGKKDDAAYWFYIAQLRARIDANLTTDESAKQAVTVLNDKYGPDINQYAFQDIAKLEQTVTKVVDFVRENHENYDHRWIYLHGMQAIELNLNNTNEKQDMIKPKEEWEAIKTKTIDDYYQGFKTYVKEQE